MTNFDDVSPDLVPDHLRGLFARMQHDLWKLRRAIAGLEALIRRNSVFQAELMAQVEDLRATVQRHESAARLARAAMRVAEIQAEAFRERLIKQYEIDEILQPKSMSDLVPHA